MAAPSTACPAQPPSVLDALGDELTSVLTPVSVCMMLTVVLVKLLSPHGTEGAASDARRNRNRQEKRWAAVERVVTGGRAPS